MKKILISAIGMLAIVTVQEVKSQEHIPETDIYQTEERNDMMEKVRVEITRLREQNYSCSQATLLGICRTLGSNLPEQQIMAFSAGFRAVSDAPIMKEPAEHSRLESWLWVYTCLMKTRKQSLCPKSCSTISSRRMER